METPVSEAEYSIDYNHNTQEHGPMWALLNQMLHIIVLVYTVFGMIRFKVIFISMVKLVRWIALLTVCLNWYISIKFALLAIIFYLFNMELESRKISSPLQFNCSLAHYGTDSMRANQSSAPIDNQRGGHSSSGILLASLLHHIGGPFRLLGNRATLMYGFFSISIYIMLALFPVEHYYFDIGFNYIRFVLNDSSCLRSCYAKKQRHVDRLNNWSRNMNSSMITLSMKRAINQRDLRSSYLAERYFGGQPTAGPAEQRQQRQQQQLRREAPPLRAVDSEESDTRDVEQLDVGQQPNWYDETYGQMFAERLVRVREADDWSSKLRRDSSRWQRAEERLRAPIKSLRHTLSTNHSNEPSYNVKVANENLKRFKPYVRSERWFKISMVIYPIFIFFYFTSLMVVIGAITWFLYQALQWINGLCFSELKSRGFLNEEEALWSSLKKSPGRPSTDLFAGWSLWDRLTFLEGKYSVFALSCASSFYCSYYFGTILELFVWIEEISQQLKLSRVVIELIELRPPPVSLVGALTSTFAGRSPSATDGLLTRAPVTPVGLLESLGPYHGSERNLHAIGEHFNQFGGLNSIWEHCKLWTAPQSERLRKYELMAISLANKKQTILRSTYINLNMFFDELNDTRFMTTIILRRTTQIAFAFALMVSITRSQFESNLFYLSALLFSCLAILNLYLICAASINSSINKLLPQIHALISVSIIAGTEHDLLEFWLRHIQAYGLDRDAMSYKIYGYKVTWSTILNRSK